MTEPPPRGDWQAEDAPKCEDCVHHRDHGGTYDRCAAVMGSHTTYAFTSAARLDMKSAITGKPSCGPEARYFERKTPTGDYQFQTNPPILGAWREE